MHITHHGGHLGVTGSCHQLHLDHHRSILVDCGMFQGADARGREEMGHRFLPGWGAVACGNARTHRPHRPHSLPTRSGLSRTNLLFASDGAPDADQLEDAMRLGITRNKRLIQEFLKDLKRRVRPLPYGRWEKLEGDIMTRFSPAGHVLGFIDDRNRSWRRAIRFQR